MQIFFGRFPKVVHDYNNFSLQRQENTQLNTVFVEYSMFKMTKVTCGLQIRTMKLKYSNCKYAIYKYAD